MRLSLKNYGVFSTFSGTYNKLAHILSVKTDVFFNRIYVIESLFKDDKKSGQILCDNILKYQVLKSPNFSYELIPTETKEQLFQSLRKIKDSIQIHKWLPYLHFEVHGCEDGIVLNSNTLVEWNELYNVIQEINIICYNNLFISMATCHGAYMIRIYSKFSEPCPFYGFIGPYSKLGEIDLINGYSEYFERLLETKDFGTAIKALRNANPMNKEEFNFLNCEAFFDLIINNLRKDHTDPKRRTQNAKILAKNWRKKFPELIISNNELVRRFERVMITDSDSIVSKMRDTFCMK